MIPLTFGEFNYGQLPTMYKVTEDQKESLYHDGFVVLSKIVPEAARHHLDSLALPSRRKFMDFQKQFLKKLKIREK